MKKSLKYCERRANYVGKKGADKSCLTQNGHKSSIYIKKKKKPHFWIVIKQRAIQWGMSVSEMNFLPL